MRPGRYVAVPLALVAALAGCGGGDPTPAQAVTQPVTQPVTRPAVAAGAVASLSPAAFARRMKATKGMVINVHVPDEGEIPGTDAHINYLSISISEALPADSSTELLLYCRSGSMSAEAGQSLLRAGWTNVAELVGGFNAWRSSGRKFIPGPA